MSAEIQLNEITYSKLALEFNGFPSSIRPFLLFLLAFAFSVYVIRRKVGKQSEKLNKLKTIKDLQTYQNFSFWMPSIIEVLVTMYKIRKDGLRITSDWWSSLNHSGMWVFKTPIQSVVITDPTLIKEVLGSPLVHFLHKPKFLYDAIFSEIIKDGLVASHLNIWKPHRKILNQYFTHGTLSTHLKTINKYGNAIIQNLENFSSVDIKEDTFSSILYDKILSIILEILLGEQIVDEMGTRELPKYFRQWQNLVVYRFLNQQNLVEFIWKLNPKRKAYLDSISYLSNYIKEGISKSRLSLEGKRICDGDEFARKLSCVEHMLLNGFTEKEIMDEVATILYGGHDTADTTLHFLLQHLAEHPHIQRKCQNEIDIILDSTNLELNIARDDIAQFKYLEQCILETLRLTPVVPVIARELGAQTRLENYVLEKGTKVLFPQWLIHRDPEIYPEPEKFDPDRFLPENVKARHPYAFLPFSMGPRNCIGWKLGMMELKTIVSLILRNYDIFTSDKLTDVKLHFDITLSPERPFNLVLHKRKL